MKQWLFFFFSTGFENTAFVEKKEVLSIYRGGQPSLAFTVVASPGVAHHHSGGGGAELLTDSRFFFFVASAVLLHGDGDAGTAPPAVVD